MSGTAWTPGDAEAMAGLLRRARRGMRALGQGGGERLWDLYQDAVRHLAGRSGRQGTHAAATAGLAVRALGVLYRPRGPSARGLWTSVTRDVPRTVRAQGQWVLAAAAWYAAVALAAGLAAAHSSAWAAVLLQGAVPQGGGHAAVAAGPDLVVALFFHNTLASAAAYAGGIAAGLGSVAALALNGALVGALLGVVAAHGPIAPVAALLAPHAVLELPATFCAGGGGLAMGAACLAPGERTRSQALAQAFRRTVPLFGCCVAWLAGAALVEGLFTPLPMPAAVKLGAAGVLAILFALYLTLAAPDKTAGPPAAPAPQAAAPTLHPLGARPGQPPAARAAAPRRAPAVALRLPEGVELALQPAGVPSRALALFVDIVILSAGFGAVLLGLAVGMGSAASTWLVAGLAVYLAAFYGLYGFLFEWLGHGSTPGKRALHLAVLRADGRPLDASAALLRNLLRIVDFLPAFYATGLVAALASGGSRRLGDWAAGTVVVHLPSVPRARRAHGRAGSPLPLPQVRRCGPLPDAAALRQIPASWRDGLVDAWQRGAAGSPAGRRLTEACARRAALDFGEASAEAGTEHLLAALDRAGLAGGTRWSSTAPRSRADDLAPRAPSPASVDRVPDALAASVLDFWARLPRLDPQRRGPVAAALGARLARALGAPGLDQPDPDALVEHVAHVLRSR